MQGAHSSFRDMPCKGIARLSGVVGTLLDKNPCVGEHESWQNVGKPLLQLWEGQIIGRRDGGEVGTEIGLICLTILEYVLQIWQGNDLTVLKM